MTKTSHDSEIPAQGQQVFTACAFIHQKNDGIEKVFLPKRAATKKFLPGVFELPGGHIDYGEHMKVGLVREIKEEFDMDIEVGDPFFVFTYANPVKGSHSIEVIYFAKFTSGIKDIKIDPEDHSEYGWYSQDELKKTYNDEKGADDTEIKAMHKGFGLLKGDSLEF